MRPEVEHEADVDHQLHRAVARPASLSLVVLPPSPRLAHGGARGDEGYAAGYATGPRHLVRHLVPRQDVALAALGLPPGARGVIRPAAPHPPLPTRSINISGVRPEKKRVS